MGLQQHQLDMTRRVSNNILDLVYSSNPNLVTHISTVPGMSDHDAVLTSLDTKPKYSQKPSHKVYQYRKANFAGLKADITTLTNNFLLNQPLANNVNSNWLAFKEALISAINKHVPTKMRKHRRDIPWLTPNTRRHIRKRERMYKLARNRKSTARCDAYRQKRNIATKLLKQAHNTYVSDVIGSSLIEGSNQKKCWSYVKLNHTENTSIPVLQDKHGHHVTNQAKAEALSRQFSSVFTEEAVGEIPTKGPSPYPNIGHITFTQPGITKQLQKVKPEKAGGPDEIPARVIKEAAEEISPFLTLLFQQSFEQGAIPDDWSKALVSAIYK